MANSTITVLKRDFEFLKIKQKREIKKATLRESLRASLKDVREGRIIGPFKTAQAAIRALERAKV